jgi:hypothetical protein
MIERYPEHMYTTRYLNQVITSGRLDGETWGYDVCTNLTIDNTCNKERQQNGKPFNRHFRAINADFTTTRRCCTGIQRNCDSCFDTWEHFSWIMINMRKHLGSRREFADWLTTMFAFYVVRTGNPARLPGLGCISRKDTTVGQCQAAEKARSASLLSLQL